MRTARIRHIDVLPARAARPEGIDAQLFQLDIDFDLVVDLRVNENEANEVWRRALASKGEMRTSR